MFFLVFAKQITELTEIIEVYLFNYFICVVSLFSNELRGLWWL